MRPVFWMGLCMACSIILVSYLSPAVRFWIAGASFLLGFDIFRRGKKKKDANIMTIAWMLWACILGILLFHLSEQRAAVRMQSLLDQDVWIQAEVLDKSQENEKIRYLLQTEEIRLPNGECPIEQTITIQVTSTQVFSLRDTIVSRVQLYRPDR